MVDITLIEKCIKADRVAQRQLYLLTKEPLKLIAIRYCQDLHDAQDVIQNSYLRIFKNLSSYKFSKGSFETWASTIVINESIRLIKKNRKFITQEMEENLSFTSQEDGIWQSFAIEEILSLFDKLKLSEKTLLNLFYIDQYTYKEISNMLGIQESSVRANLSRARRRLLKHWHHQNNTNYEKR